jgi:hypothetical protein
MNKKGEIDFILIGIILIVVGLIFNAIGTVSSTAKVIDKKNMIIEYQGTAYKIVPLVQQ